MTSALSAATVVSAWETARSRAPLDQAIAVLWAAREPADIADLPIAERDRKLLVVHSQTFGQTLELVTHCPHCGEALELEIVVGELHDRLAPPNRETVNFDDGSIDVHPLSSRDLAAASRVPAEQRVDFLSRRACRDVDLPAEALELVQAQVEAHADAAQVHMSMTCASCDGSWSDVLDIASHVWHQVAVAAQRVLGEVVEIAATTGWSESDILHLTETRRAAYLQIVRSQ